MIIDKYSFIIRIDGKDLELRLNYRTLKNLYKLTNESPLRWLGEFLTGNDDIEALKYQCIQIIYSMLDGDVSLFTLNDIMTDENLLPIFMGLSKAIELELKAEIIKEEDDDKNDNSDDDDEVYLWNIFFNNSYYTAIYELGKSEEEFFEMSIRELKTLDFFRKQYRKNILLDTFITIEKAKNKSSKVEVDNLKEANARNKLRIRDLLTR